MGELSLIDELIWQRRRALTSSDFEQIVSHLVSALSSFLECPITKLESVQEAVVDAESFCCSVRSETSMGGPLNLAWEGRLGMQPVGPGKKAWVSASLFLFCFGSRMAVQGHTGSYLELVYELDAMRKGRWRIFGWELDVYSEYTDVDYFGSRRQGK